MHSKISLSLLESIMLKVCTFPRNNMLNKVINDFNEFKVSPTSIQKPLNNLYKEIYA